MKIKDIREGLKLSQQDFAFEVGASISTIAKWEAAEKDSRSPGINRAFRTNLLRMEKKATR